MPNPKLFQDPHTKYPIYQSDLAFSDYIAAYRKIIAETRLDLQDHPELVISTNSPFELRATNPTQGALLIHGLLDSPFIMRDVGNYLNSRGFLARSIVLPGHSTVPGSLLNVQYSDWLQTLRYGVTSLAKEVEKIYLVGSSTGASLALYHALHHDNIAGLILLSPAIKIRSIFDFASNWYECISFAWERAKWLHQCDEIDYAKYQSIPFNAVYQVYRLGLALKKLSAEKSLNCPIFMALSEDDTTVSSAASLAYFKKYASTDSRMILYTNNKMPDHDPRMIIRPCAYPSMNIVNSSHIAIPTAPDNPHYGKNGDYIFASHMDKNILYGAENKVGEMFYEILYQLKLTKYHHRRLSFNPDFEYMMKEITDTLCAEASPTIG